MKEWLISIVGVVFLGVLVDIISPNGKTNNIIKCVFSLFVLIVIVTPVLKLFKKDWNIETNIQGDWIESVKAQRVSALEAKVGNYLYEKGIACVVEIDAEDVGNCINIGQVKIYISKNVLNGMDEHINKYKHITDLVKEIVEVDEEIVVYEVL